MFGTLRFVLASIVLVSHCIAWKPGFNHGVSAVVVFFVLSGYAMTGLVMQHYSRLSQLISFYIDRIMRIYPQYLCFVLLVMVGVGGGFLHSPDQVLAFQATTVFANLTAVPLSFFMYVPEWRVIYVPPTVTLGVELQFYLLIPLILHLRLRLWCFLASLVVFTLAFWQLLNPTLHGYRLVSGTLCLFLLGSFLYSANQEQPRTKAFVVAIYLYFVTLAVLLFLFGQLPLKGIRLSILVGLLVGFPILAYLSKQARQTWDEFLGALSYGLFLAHVPVKIFLEQWAFFRVHRDSYESLFVVVAVLLCKLLLVFVGSLVLAYVGYRWVELPIIAVRRRLRVASAQGATQAIQKPPA